MKRRHDMPFGAAVIAPDLVRFRLWAPAAGTVELCLEPGDEMLLPMRRHSGDGSGSTTVARLDRRATSTASTAA